jgi:hypothetical protein
MYKMQVQYIIWCIIYASIVSKYVHYIHYIMYTRRAYTLFMISMYTSKYESGFLFLLYVFVMYETVYIYIYEYIREMYPINMCILFM